ALRRDGARHKPLRPLPGLIEASSRTFPWIVERGNQFGKVRLLNEGGCFPRRKPTLGALLALGPLAAFFGHLKRDDGHFAAKWQATVVFLQVVVAAKFARCDATLDACFLEGLAGGCSCHILAAVDPALGKDPAPGAAAGDQQNFNLAAVPLAPWKRCDLNAGWVTAKKTADAFLQSNPFTARRHRVPAPANQRGFEL